MNVLAYDLVDVLSWILGFLLVAMWICLFVVVLSHIVWGHDLSAWGQGFLAGLSHRRAADRRARLRDRPTRQDHQATAGGGQVEQAALRGYGKDTALADPRTPAVDTARLAELHDRGLLTDEEYVRQRMRGLS